jgi:hypothetical protein
MCEPSCEPLHSLLVLYQNTDEVLQTFLPDETTHHLLKYSYIGSDEVFLREKMIAVSKRTGLIEARGPLVGLSETVYTIRVGRQNLRMSSEEYYLFKRHKTEKQTKETSEFYKALLSQL